MIHATNTAIVVPRANSTMSPILIELGPVWAAEQRIEEIATVNAHKAPELLSVFNRAYLDISRQVAMLEYELVEAETAANKMKAIVILDKAPAILEAKGLTTGKSRAGSEDLRNAVLAQDEDYQKALDICQQIECIVKLLQGKMKGLEMAYNSVKKILGEGSFNNTRALPNPGSGTGVGPVGLPYCPQNTGDKETITWEAESGTTPPRSQIGRAKY